MKLVIQIPCHNEEQTLPPTVRDLPQSIPGVDVIEVLVIDDGSTDRTVDVARELGVRHIIRHTRNQGLAYAFRDGLEASLAVGADIIVNTDGDNQYRGEDIARLIQPILEGQADIVVGDRGVAASEHFSPIKRWLQQVGSWVVQRAAGISILDATSGLRAFTREAALRLTVLGEYTYTLETLIQAGARKMALMYVPVRTNPKMRPSRLIRSVPSFMALQAVTILRFYTMYSPLRMFTATGCVLIAGGVVLGLRFLYLSWQRGGWAGNIQSLILAAILTIVGFQVCMIGLIADLVSLNRKMLEETLYRVRKMELEHGQQPESERQE
jgi:glycosyltransferase involved in cell wall biosynthesis